MVNRSRVPSRTPSRLVGGWRSVFEALSEGETGVRSADGGVVAFGVDFVGLELLLGEDVPVGWDEFTVSLVGVIDSSVALGSDISGIQSTDATSSSTSTSVVNCRILCYMSCSTVQTERGGPRMIGRLLINVSCVKSTRNSVYEAIQQYSQVFVGFQSNL